MNGRESHIEILYRQKSLRRCGVTVHAESTII
jgi:hypothetical protein